MPRKTLRGWGPVSAAARRGPGGGSSVTDSRSLSPRSRGRQTPPLPEAPSRSVTYTPALVCAMTWCIGANVSVQTRNGDCFEGVLHTPALDQYDVHFVLKKARKMNQDGAERDFIEKLVIPSSEVVQMYAEDLSKHQEPPRPVASPVLTFPVHPEMANQAALQFGDFDDLPFLGDHDRERLGAGLVGRELEKWEPEEGTAILTLGDMDHEVGSWDQFAENEKKFGVKTDFNMDLYTTRLEPEKSKYSVEQATRIARDILSASTPNLHLQDERNQLKLDDSGVSDEMLYSSVLTEALRRAPETANGETPKKSEPLERNVQEDKTRSSKSPEPKKAPLATLILPVEKTQPLIINRPNKGGGAGKEYFKLARHLQSKDLRLCVAFVMCTCVGPKPAPHGSPLDTSPLVNDRKGLKALDLTFGSGHKKILDPADREKFLKFKAENAKKAQVNDSLGSREEAIASLRQFKDEQSRKTPKSEEGSPFIKSPMIRERHSAETFAVLDVDSGFGSQMLDYQDETPSAEGEGGSGTRSIPSQIDLPPLKTTHGGVDDEELPEENSGRGLNPHAMPFNPGQAYENTSESNTPLTGLSGTDGTAVDPSPQDSPVVELEPPARLEKPFSSDELEHSPPVISTPIPPETVRQQMPPPPPPTVLIRTQPPPPPPRVATPPPPPVQLQDHQQATPVMMPSVRPPYRPQNKSPSSAGRRTPMNPLHQDPSTNMIINSPHVMMPASQPGPQTQVSGPPLPSNGQPPQMVPGMMPHMSGAMHMMQQSMSPYPYMTDMAGRVPIMYPFAGPMTHVPGPPAPPGQQNNPNGEQPMQPAHVVYNPYYPGMPPYPIPYGHPMMHQGMQPHYVPMAPAPMTPQRPGSNPRPRPNRRKTTNSFLNYGARRG